MSWCPHALKRLTCISHSVCMVVQIILSEFVPVTNLKYRTSFFETNKMFLVSNITWQRETAHSSVLKFNKVSSIAAPYQQHITHVYKWLEIERAICQSPITLISTFCLRLLIWNPWLINFLLSVT